MGPSRRPLRFSPMSPLARSAKPKNRFPSRSTQSLRSNSGKPLSLFAFDWMGQALRSPSRITFPDIGTTGKYRPHLRSLIPYFIRRGKDAYSQPFEFFRKKPTVRRNRNIAKEMEKYQVPMTAPDGKDKGNNKLLMSALATRSNGK